MSTEHDENGSCSGCAGDPLRVSRRTLLKAGIGAIGLTALPGVSVGTAFAAPGYTGDTLIVLSLRGGFDGLSAIAPVGDPYYAKARPTMAIAPREGLMLDSMFVAHPAMKPVMGLWSAGQLAVVHAVGTMDRTRSHFSAMQQVEQASVGSSDRTGWLDRMLGLRTGTSTWTTMAMDYRYSLAWQGPVQNMAAHRLGQVSLSGAYNEPWSSRTRTALTQLYGAAPASPLASSLPVALDAVDSAAALRTYASPAQYPDTPLAASLSDLAALIKSGVGLQIATVDQGDWDFHDNSRSRFDRSMTILAGALAAFAQDLGPAWSKVTVVTLSEFGRQVYENSNGGTDHGFGNAMLLAGGGLNGAKVHGTWMGLQPDKLDSLSLAGTTDYRDVLSEALTRRCGVSASQLTSIFPGFRPRPVNAFRPL